MKVLALGVEVVGEKTLARQITEELHASKCHDVSTAWIRLGAEKKPKFVMINTLITSLDISRCDYLLICDDDIALPNGFLDRYLEIVERCDLALAQPARTHGSEIHHPIVEQVDGDVARETRFVEIGPLFSMRRDVIEHMTPFDELSPMGWGYDYAWPPLIASLGRKMGIVDATPVEHRMRPAVSGYDMNEAAMQMGEYLQTHAHLSPDRAYTTVREFRA